MRSHRKLWLNLKKKAIIISDIEVITVEEVNVCMLTIVPRQQDSNYLVYNAFRVFFNFFRNFPYSVSYSTY